MSNEIITDPRELMSEPPTESERTQVGGFVVPPPAPTVVDAFWTGTSCAVLGGHLGGSDWIMRMITWVGTVEALQKWIVSTAEELRVPRRLSLVGGSRARETTWQMRGWRSASDMLDVASRLLGDDSPMLMPLRANWGICYFASNCQCSNEQLSVNWGELARVMRQGCA